MAEKSTVARPYAQAVFALASKQGKLPQWSATLRLLALVMGDPRMQQLSGNPRVTEAKIAGLIEEICGDQLDKHGRALVALLIRNRRLPVLPEIAALYGIYRAEAEKMVEAEVVSAFPMSKDQEQALTAALKKRLGREVKLTCRTDQSLIGGAVIRAGDLVIDGSVTGQLHRLTSAVAH
jgi:F-type H+-transporting ATPase subunit delta